VISIYQGRCPWLPLLIPFGDAHTIFVQFMRMSTDPYKF